MGLLFNSRGFSICPTCLKSFAMFSSLDADVIVPTEHGLGPLGKGTIICRFIACRALILDVF